MYLTELIMKEFQASSIGHLGKSSLLEVHFNHGDAHQKKAMNGVFQILCEKTLSAMVHELASREDRE